MSRNYAHMCQDEHIEIGHNDSEHEMCPLCRAIAERDKLREVNAALLAVAIAVVDHQNSVFDPGSIDCEKCKAIIAGAKAAIKLAHSEG